MSLVLRILIGLVIGAVLGMVVPEWTGFSILGQVFVSALKAIAPVLVAVLVAMVVYFLACLLLRVKELGYVVVAIAERFHRKRPA